MFLVYFVFSPLSPLTEVSSQPSAIPGGNPLGDWRSALSWGDDRFKPGTAGQQSGALPLSHHTFPKLTHHTFPKLSHHTFPLSHHTFGRSTFTLQFCSCSIIRFCIIICCQFIFHCLSVVIRHLASCFIFTFVHPAQSFWICFCFILFDYSLFDYSVLFLFWFWKYIPGILIPITATIRQVNKHYTTRLRHLLS